jgi:hypothetical protein
MLNILKTSTKKNESCPQCGKSIETSKSNFCSLKCWQNAYKYQEYCINNMHCDNPTCVYKHSERQEKCPEEYCFVKSCPLIHNINNINNSNN